MNSIYEDLTEGNNSKWIIILLSGFVILIPLVLRIISGNPTFIGEESYYNLKVSQNFLSSFGNEIINPYHIVLLPFAYLGNFGILLFQTILSIVASILMIKILKRMNFIPEKIFYAVIFAILSPVYIFTFTSLTYHSFSFILMLLGIYELLKISNAEKPKKIDKLITSIAFLLFGMFSFFHTLLAILIVLIFLILKKEKKEVNNSFASKILESYFAFTSLIGGLIFLIINNHSRFVFYYEFAYATKGFGIFSELGSLVGFSSFTILLFVIGIFTIWSKKEKHYFAYSILAVLIVASFSLSRSINIYLNFFVAYFAAIIFYDILKRDWVLKEIKFLTILLIVCGILFSAVSFEKRIIYEYPKKDIIKAVEYTGNKVITDPKYGYLLEYFKRESFINSNNFNQKIFEYNDIMMETNLEIFKKKLSENEIDTIMITSEMKREYWHKEDTKILLLVVNKESFEKVYSTDSVEIYKVKK